MANKTDDDYWFSSDTKAFNFEDEASLQRTFKTSTFIKTKPKDSSVYDEGNELTDEFQRSDIQIRSVLSQQCLDKLLNNNSTQNVVVLHDNHIQQIVNKMLLNLPYSLEDFKNLLSKTKLLDAAINTADGNAILTVVLFLASTLRKDIFYKLLSARRVALLHYINYLSIRLNTKELSNLLMLTGYSTTIGIKLFKLTIYNTNNADDEGFKKKLEILYSNHFSKLTSEKDNQILKSYIDLIEWQYSVQKFSNMKSVSGKSVNKCLAACCQFYWDKSAEHICSTQCLSKLQGISERQLHWIFLDVKSSIQAWEEIQKMFIKNVNIIIRKGNGFVQHQKTKFRNIHTQENATPEDANLENICLTKYLHQMIHSQNWFGTRKVMTCSLSAENVVVLLGEREAPSSVLEQFLPLVEDPEQALGLALRYHCHQHVIAHYLANKDRSALLTYKSKISPQSEHYFFLENAVLSLGNK